MRIFVYYDNLSIMLQYIIKTHFDLPRNTNNLLKMYFLFVFFSSEPIVHQIQP